MADDPWRLYMDIPVVSRVFLTLSVATTAACFLNLVSPLTLYYNLDLVLHRGQYWRLFSSFFFFGTVGIDFVFHMYFVSRYCRMLEEGIFRNRPADFVTMMLFGALCMIGLSYFIPLFSKIKFLGHPLSFMMVYIWGRYPDNADIRMSMFGIFTFSAPYLPWVMLGFSAVLGNPLETDLLGIVAGHLYYFLAFVFPSVAEIRGWRVKQLIHTPRILHLIMGTAPLGQVGDDEIEVVEVHPHQD